MAVRKDGRVLAGAVRAIAAGRRDPGQLGGLDDEDRVIAEAIGFSAEDANVIEMAAPMHDIGKIGINQELVPDVAVKTIAVIQPETIGVEKGPKGTFITEQYMYLIVKLTLPRNGDKYQHPC